LKDRGYKVFTAPEQKQIPGTSLLKNRAGLEKMSLLVVLGGDGTYLRSIRLLEGKTIPILGVNLGSLGFLTPTRADELFTAVEQTLQNKMELRPRSMMKLQLFRNNKKRLEILALNDIVIERGSLSQLINISIHCGKSLVSEIKADGLIISTPTGSTAYNLSAGGPILHPDVRAIVVTSIAPHSLTSRPLIFPDESQLRFSLVGKLADKLNKVKGKAHLIIDGVQADLMGEDDEVVIQRSSSDHLMVKDPDHDYFNLLREKLKFGDRA
jgi:NAD+ kinase